MSTLELNQARLEIGEVRLSARDQRTLRTLLERLNAARTTPRIPASELRARCEGKLPPNASLFPRRVDVELKALDDLGMFCRLRGLPADEDQLAAHCGYIKPGSRYVRRLARPTDQ